MHEISHVETALPNLNFILCGSTNHGMPSTFLPGCSHNVTQLPGAVAHLTSKARVWIFGCQPETLALSHADMIFDYTVYSQLGEISARDVSSAFTYVSH